MSEAKRGTHFRHTFDEISSDGCGVCKRVSGVSVVKATQTEEPRLCRMGDSVAACLEVDPQLPSRAAMAMSDVLLAASRDRGHTFLSWEQLQEQSLQYLNSTGEATQGYTMRGGF